MGTRLQEAASIALVGIAVVMGSVVINREFGFFRTGPTLPTAESAEYLENWREVAATGVELGDSAGQQSLLVFNDLECPGCRAFHGGTVRNLVLKGNTSVRFFHFPLTGHRFANLAARVVECGGIVGRFREAVDLVFDKQDSLGLKPWRAFGSDLGTPDVAQFEKCVTGPQEFPRIGAGTALGKRLGVQGTPTIIVNGWLYRRIPGEDELMRALADTADRAPPVSR